jgi:putative iron-only hydrogenase system regulator
MNRIAVIGLVLDNPQDTQDELNRIVSEYNGIIKGRMGLPFKEENMGVISLVAVAEMNLINSLTGRLGKIPGTSVKTAVSKREILQKESHHE